MASRRRMLLKVIILGDSGSVFLFLFVFAFCCLFPVKKELNVKKVLFLVFFIFGYEIRKRAEYSKIFVVLELICN